MSHAALEADSKQFFSSQFFVTEIVPEGQENSLQIVTLPGRNPAIYEKLAADFLSRLADEGWQMAPTSPRSAKSSSAKSTLFIDTLQEALSAGQISELFPEGNDEDFAVMKFVSTLDFNLSGPVSRKFAREVFEQCQLPILNSPLSGVTLKGLVEKSVGGGAVVIALSHPLSQVPIYLLLIAGAIIVVGAAKGISSGLEHGLRHVILKHLGAPDPTPAPPKPRRRPSKK